MGIVIFFNSSISFIEITSDPNLTIYNIQNQILKWYFFLKHVTNIASTLHTFVKWLFHMMGFF